MKSKRLIVLTMVLILAFSVFAGGTKEEVTTGESSNNFNAEGLPIFKEPETFTIAVMQESPLKKAGEKACAILTEEATNVHINWMEIPKSAWEEKINIMASTGTLPDAVIGEAYLDRNYELFAPLDELLAQYAPVVSRRIADRPDYQMCLKAPDGKIHALPNGDESIHNLIPTAYWINQVWLDKLGLDLPTTVDDFYKVLKAFKTQDPNGNGLSDEIPFAFQTGWNWSTSIKNFFGAFGVVEYYDHVFMEGNKVVMSSLTENYYAALKYLNGLYKEGLINDDVFTVSNDQFSALGAGKEIIGCFAGYSNSFCCGQPNPDDFVALPILSSAYSEGVTGGVKPTRVGGFSINANCKNPAALIRWYEYINSSLENAALWGRGEQGFIWDIQKDADGERPILYWVTTEQYKERGYMSKSEYRKAESFAGETPAVWWYDYAIDTLYPDWPIDKKLEAVKKDLPRAVYGLPAATATKENSSRRSILLVDIDNYLSKFVADSVVNGIDDAKWAKHLQAMKSLKAEEYVRLCQEFVDSLF